MPRPVAENGNTFDLTYIREGPPGGTPLLLIPGGPGLASVLPYRKLRKAAARRGFDVVMVEHRGVGLSRTDRAGADLPMTAMTTRAVVDDLAAALDHCGWRRAVVYGTSYGGHLAQAFGTRHPERVRAMVLDSTAARAGAEENRREHIRDLLWHGTEPDTAPAAATLREMVAEGLVPREGTGLVIPIAYEFGGAALVQRLLEAVRNGRTYTWNQIARLASREVNSTHPYYLEFDLAGAIYYRELGSPQPDGGVLDPHVLFDQQAERFPPYAGPTVDPDVALSSFTWPTAVLSGRRDMRSVRPTARRTAETLPDGVLVPLENSAHSFLDFHPRLALTAAAATANGAQQRLPELADRLEGLRRPPQAKVLGPLFTAGVAADRALSTADRLLPRARA